MPSTARMATFDPQIRRQSFGFFVNRILPRVQEQAYSDDGADSDVDDWHHDANKKKRMAVEAYQDQKEMAKALGGALLTSGPANVFSLRLQSQDRHGGSIRDLVDPGQKSSRWQCLSSYWEILNPWYDSEFCEHLDAMLWYMEGAGHTADEAHGILSASDLGMAAAVWTRNYRFMQWPWPLTHAASSGDKQAFYFAC
jgi:hypothetical protein